VEEIYKLHGLVKSKIWKIQRLLPRSSEQA